MVVVGVKLLVVCRVVGICSFECRGVVCWCCVVWFVM